MEEISKMQTGAQLITILQEVKKSIKNDKLNPTVEPAKYAALRKAFDETDWTFLRDCTPF